MSTAQERFFIAPHALQPDLPSPEDAWPVLGKTPRPPAGAMIQLDMFNQPLMVARKNRGSADIFPKGCSLPFEIGFPAIGGFVYELDGFIHAAKKAAMAWTPKQGPPSTEASSV